MTVYGVQSIPLHLIDPNPWQTRRPEAADSERIRALADDIKVNTMLQIPTGRRVEGTNRVQLAFGHSRLYAYRLLYKEGDTEFAEFPVNLITDLSDHQMAIFAFAENEKRQDLDPIERAEAIRKMLIGFSWTQQELADHLKIDRSSVANALRMLSLPGDIQQSIMDGILPVRSAMVLMPYYELTPLEKSALERIKPDHSDFLALARSGQLNSDAIRAEIGIWMQLLHPKPIELPLVPETPSPQPSPETGEGEESGAMIQNTITAMEEEPQETSEPANDGLEDLEPEPLVPGVLRVPEPKPAAAPAPTPAPAPAAQPSKDIVLMIRWYEAGGVGIAVQHPGEVFPRFIHKATLTAAEFPELLEGMGIA